ncbi:hypothetical protein [Nonomuraea turcica]|uniref:hypothetical protein n=1 Tax=Nonomuraea sp. G32 TaxID=3067274 RepID=UPI00273C450A|nr:hypothetical protein [Nonomuraea sp. G32]MDP4503235.1 hypothetical protein [Nonomuraea sp. G32]
MEEAFERGDGEWTRLQPVDFMTNTLARGGHGGKAYTLTGPQPYTARQRRDPPPEAYTVVPTVREITGREPRTFEQWVRGHARHFTP